MWPKCFGHISVEPVAFLAILALYIEFPSIQDLIYTKICLQIVADHPNFVNLTTNNPVQHNAASTNLTNIIEVNLSAVNQILPTNDNSVQSRVTALSARDHFLCDRLNRSAVPADIRQEITDEDSLFWLKNQVIICLLCALSCPYWGGMSDKIGRIIPLNVTIAAGALSNLLSLIFGLLISMNSHASFSVEWLYVGSVLVGLSGGQAVVIISSFSFISDNTSDDSRSKRIVVLEAVIFLSHSVGFFLSKHIMKLGLATPEHPWLNRHVVAFSICVLLNLLSMLYSLLKLRHQRFHRFLNNFEREHQEAFAGAQPIGASAYSITTDQRAGDSVGGPAPSAAGCGQRRDDGGFAGVERLRDLTASTPDDLDGPVARSDKRWTGMSSYMTLKYYAQTYSTLTKERESRAIILLLILCGFISATCLTALMSLLYIYLRSEPFYWTTSQYSSWNATTSVTRGLALVLLSVSMKFSKFWNIPDALVAAMGFLSKGVGLLMIGLAKDSTIIDWALLAFVLSEFSMPPIRSLLSKLVVQEEVGKIYSCLAAAQNLCFLLGNVIFYLAYSSTKIRSFFRLSFLVVAGLQLAAFIIMVYIFSSLRRRVIVV